MDSCRLCLGDFLQPLPEDAFSIHSMEAKLRTVFTFEIPYNKRLSKSICPDCAITVSKLYNFATTVHQNQQQLLDQIDDEDSMQAELGAIIEKAVRRSPKENYKHLFRAMSEETAKVQQDPEISVKITRKQKSKSAAIRFERNLISRYLDMVCDLCHEDQYTYQRLETHFRRHHGRRVAYVVCCGEKLSSEGRISEHLQKHMNAIKSPKVSAKVGTWERRVELAFGSMLSDFKRDLEGYEPLPDMAAALKGDIEEQKKMYDVQDYLVQTYFTLDCELCGLKISNLNDRRMHFRQNHPSEKYFVSCCRQRFSPRISIMRHLNRHWRHESARAKVVKQVKMETEAVESARLKQDQAVYGPLMNEFREDLIEGGFTPPKKIPETKTVERMKRLHQMQDYLIAKHTPLNCELCGAEISTYTGRQNHFKIGHPKEKFYIQCCGKTMFTRQGVIVHLLRHRKGLPTTVEPSPTIRQVPENSKDDALIEAFYKMDCELCDYTGSSYLDLRVHFQKSHREEGFFITCCNRRFKTKYHIVEHINSHRKPPTKCDHCEATFFSERSRSVEEIFHCDQCVESFPSRNLLTLHTYKHELVACEICGAEMKRCALRVHRLNVHKLDEEIVCHVCARVYHSKSVFNKHYREAHLGIRRKSKRKSRAKKKRPAQEAVTDGGTEWQVEEE
ncbi:transcription factor grauzone-like [Culex pipiens pallens]|uniref:transcription factor grauzone-like n=1 Tax=Culex pipiens pallens TaxID=42434 RepID=UPI001954C065|nr:transcription factor grauzone-like [Culex pipiens pallens]